MKQTGWRYTVYMTDEGWVAECHCDCVSTVTGDPRAQTSDAITGARRALERHLARASVRSSCGTRNHDPAKRLEDEIKAEASGPAFLAKLEDHGGGDAPDLSKWPHMVIR